MFVAGQTVGPVLHDHHRALVKQMVDYAVCFSAREWSTWTLLRELTDSDRLLRTLDDVVLLPEEEAPDFGERYAIGSFSNLDHYNIDKEQAERIAVELDAIAVQLDCDLVLLPHVGTFDDGPRIADESLHDAIVAYSTSGRVRAEPLLPARQLLSATRRALFTVSTRYHPAVFGPAVCSPTFSIALGHYSAVRMRGALENFGQGATFLPSPLWDRGCAARVIADLHEPATDHLNAHAAATIAYQRSWWDAVSRAITTGTWTSPGHVTPPKPLEPSPEWAETQDLAHTLILEMWEEQRGRLAAEEAALRTVELEADLEVERVHIRHLRTDLEHERDRAQRYRQLAEDIQDRKIVRAVDRLAGVVRRTTRRRRG